MKYIITSALHAGHHYELNTVQRTSPYFSEAPVVAGHTLRRGSQVTLTEEQFQISRIHIERLVRAQAIEVMEVGDTSAGPLVLSQEPDDGRDPAAPVEAQPSEPPPPEPPVDSGGGDADGEAEQTTTTDAEDPAAVVQTPAAESAATTVPAAPRKGRKGRQS